MSTVFLPSHLLKTEPVHRGCKSLLGAIPMQVLAREVHFWQILVCARFGVCRLLVEAFR